MLAGRRAVQGDYFPLVCLAIVVTCVISLCSGVGISPFAFSTANTVVSSTAWCSNIGAVVLASGSACFVAATAGGTILSCFSVSARGIISASGIASCGSSSSGIVSSHSSVVISMLDRSACRLFCRGHAASAIASGWSTATTANARILAFTPCIATATAATANTVTTTASTTCASISIALRRWIIAIHTSTSRRRGRGFSFRP